MDCHEIVANDIVEEYVLDRLDAEQRDAFEAHYFECQTCFERLEACLALRRGLARPSAKRAPQARARNPRLWLWPTAVAAAAGLAIVVVQSRSGPPLRPANDGSSASAPLGEQSPLIALGRFAPPQYTPPAWRSGSTQAEERLQAGLVRYAAGDYGNAAAALREAAQSLPGSPTASFYLGISLLATGAVNEGIASLGRVVQLGDTPYLESAHFYLAKGLLLKGDARAAQAHLETAIALRGDLESAARDLARRIQQVTQTPGGS